MRGPFLGKGRRYWPWIVLGLTAAIYVPAMSSLWDLRDRQRADLAVLMQRLPELLLDFERAIGYSGFIHDFKNAVLRGDEPRYSQGVRDSYDAAMWTLLSLESLADELGLAIDMSLVRASLDDYRMALREVERAHRDGLRAEEIDDLIRISDDAASLNLIETHDVIKAALLARASTEQRDIAILFGFVSTLLLALPGTVIVLMWFGMREQGRRMVETGALNRVLDDRNAELQNANAELKATNGKLNEFAHAAAHDLRAPIRGIANQASFLIEDHGDGLDADACRRLNRMQELCTQVEALTATLLSYSRIDSPGRVEQVRPVELVYGIKAALAGLLAERNGDVVIETDLPSLRASPASVNTVLHNLILNGLVYSDAAQPTVQVGYAPQVAVDGRLLQGVFYVRDNGIGIAEEFQTDVFRMFKRLNLPEAYGPGTGAGLAFVRKVIESLNGELVLVSRPGEGSTFYVDFGSAKREPLLSVHAGLPEVLHA